MDGFFSIDNLQRLKLGVHIAQVVFIFAAWCIMIAFFRNTVYIAPSANWYFALVGFCCF